MITPIAIPGGYSSTLTFKTRQGLEAGFDFGFVEVSTNGGSSWKEMASYSGPGELPNEVFDGQRTVNLSEFAGQSIIVRFRLESDAFNLGQPAGWYIDNITITNSDWTNLISTAGTSFVDHKPSGSYCYRVRTTFQVGQATLASAFSNVVNVTVVPGIPRIVSRKVHGTAQNSPVFDIDLPLTGSSGIECRVGGGPGANTHQVVFQFGQPVTFTSASATPQAGKTGQVTGTSGNGTKQVTVNLGNVSNVQTLTVTLKGISGAGTAANISVPMRVLPGDTNANGAVNSTDVSQTKSQSGAVLSQANFRTDVTANGAINSSDVSVVKSKSGTAVP
jgi:hypothetical protein